MVVSKGGTWSGSSVIRCPQAPREKIGWGRGWEMEARNLGGGDSRQEMKEAGWVETVKGVGPGGTEVTFGGWSHQEELTD